MALRFAAFLTDEDGSTTTDIALIIGLLVAAAVIWFVQMGGEQGLGDMMYQFSRWARNLGGSVP